MEEARKNKREKPKADRAQQKAETANGTAVNKEERLKHRV